MTYAKMQYAPDVEKGVMRIEGICFENNASDEKIDDVMHEVFNINPLPPALMTREALRLYINAPEYVLTRMDTMAIGSSFEYAGVIITRFGRLTYNGKTA